MLKGRRFGHAIISECNNNINNNTDICKAHIVSIRAESEAPAVARWRGWIVVVV